MTEGYAPPPLHEQVLSLSHGYLGRVDAALPGRIEGLYLTGSVALGDYQPGRSDIDFVAVTGTPLVEEELRRLDALHGDMPRGRREPSFDGIYVTWADLERSPVELTAVPYYLDGRFRRTGAFDANPAVWLTLHRYPVAVRGTSSPLVRHDPALLRRWSLDNLTSYWRRWATARRRIAGRGASLLAGDAIAWCVPGVARIHYTIATDDITSKSGACRYALESFPPQWHAVALEALALRRGEPSTYRSRITRRRDALGFLEWAIADAESLTGSLASRGVGSHAALSPPEHPRRTS